MPIVEFRIATGATPQQEAQLIKGIIDLPASGAPGISKK